MVERSVRRAEGIASAFPFHPLLFAAYPVLRLYAANVSEVAPGDVILPLSAVLALTALGLVFASRVLRDVRRAAIIASSIVVPVLLFGLLRDVVEPYIGSSRLVVGVACIAGVLAAIIVALRANTLRLGPITLALNVISLVLVALTAVPVARGLAGHASTVAAPRVAIASGAPASGTRASAGDAATPTRDIYHLIFDRYGSDASLMTAAGIDNSEFIAWLRDQGFVVTADARANYVRSTLSLGATLGMTHLRGISRDMGADSENYGPVVRLIENNRAGAFLQDQGYEYVHLGSWYDRTRDSRIADRSYSPETEVSFASTVFDLSVAGELVGGGRRLPFARKHADSAEYQFAKLEELVREPGPTYVFAHILLPHTPYVFLEDGTFAPSRATHETQLAYTNSRIKALLEPLLALPEDERPIVILQADEGPYPPRYEADEDGFDWTTATDDELVIKYGILSALYLPGSDVTTPPEVRSPVNTYPEVLRRYFGVDIDPLDDRSFTSPRTRPYDLYEITERLDRALAKVVPSDPG